MGAPKSTTAVKSKANPDSYAYLATRPLHVLVFLLPLIVAYEIGSSMYLTRRPGVVETIGARSILGQFFSAFGAASFLPGVAIVCVLLIWHVLLKDKWVVRTRVIVGMWLEAVLWTLPLLVLGLLLFGGGSSGRAPAASGGVGIPDQLAQLPVQARVTLAIGAGLYEEMLFRLILITALHTVLVDFMRVANAVGCVIAAMISAVAFALYHDITMADGGLNALLLAFYTLVGVYFAAIFLNLGLGVVVATHALYNIVVVAVIGGR